MEKTEIQTSIENLYQAVSHLISITEKLSNEISSMKNESHIKMQEWMTVEQLITYIPTHPTTRAVYGWVKTKKIPYHKLLGSLLFKREEIDQWIMKGAPETAKYGQF